MFSIRLQETINLQVLFCNMFMFKQTCLKSIATFDTVALIQLRLNLCHVPHTQIFRVQHVMHLQQLHSDLCKIFNYNNFTLFFVKYFLFVVIKTIMIFVIKFFKLHLNPVLITYFLYNRNVGFKHFLNTHLQIPIE